MVKLDGMSREELVEVVKMKDVLIRELKEELEAYKVLVDELQVKLGIITPGYTGIGD